MVNVKQAEESLSALTMLKYFPTEKAARAVLTRIVCDMAETNEQIDWLVSRVLSLYSEWCGPLELRAVFCSRFKPRDGLEVYSSVYPDGIPAASNPDPERALPSGTVSADRTLDSAVRTLAERKRLPGGR